MWMHMGKGTHILLHNPGTSHPPSTELFSECNEGTRNIYDQNAFLLIVCTFHNKHKVANALSDAANVRTKNHMA